MRRTLSAIVVLASLCGISPAAAMSFTDLNGTRYADAVAYLANKQIVKGYEGGKIKPNVPVNRAEALKLVVLAQDNLKSRLQYHTAHPARMPLFTDVKTSDWYSAYAETGFESGLVKGYSDGSFKGGKQVTLAEAVAMIFRSQGMNLAATGGDWYQPYIDQAKTKNLLSWREKNWSPGMTLTRGQLIDIVYRAHMVRTQNLVAFSGDPEPAPLPQTVAYGVGSTLAYEAIPGRSYIGSSTNRQYVATPAARTYQSTPPRGYVAGPVTNTTTAAATAGQTRTFSISIPALGISNMTVTHPSDPTSQQGLLSVLKNGVGHLYGLPGGNGKILIYGHSSSYSYDTSAYTKIFRTINQLKPGDRVSLTYNGKQFNYEVTGQRQIRPDDTSAFSGVGEELILYTCWPPDRIDTRLLVTARPIK